MWDGADMPSPGISLLKIVFSRKGAPNYQNPNPSLVNMGPKSRQVRQVPGHGTAHTL